MLNDAHRKQGRFGPFSVFVILALAGVGLLFLAYRATSPVDSRRDRLTLGAPAWVAAEIRNQQEAQWALEGVTLYSCDNSLVEIALGWGANAMTASQGGNPPLVAAALNDRCERDTLRALVASSPAACELLKGYDGFVESTANSVGC